MGEMKVTWELKKIFGFSEDVKVSCTAVRVPTLRAHSESIVIETEKKVDPDEARELLEGSPGVKVVDDPSSLKYPMPLNATGNHDVEVGRIRQSIIFGDNGLEFFVSGDQLLRGAALNAVLIAEYMVMHPQGSVKVGKKISPKQCPMRRVSVDIPTVAASMAIGSVLTALILKLGQK